MTQSKILKMLEFFINPWMLAGLAGLSLPVIAHLFSRRRFTIVDWAAMQFLQPGRKTRRRVKLEELLLLLLRMGLVALIVLAAARPWLPSGWLLGFYSTKSRDVVLVIDASNTMARGNGLTTVYDDAVTAASDFLERLGGDDSVLVIEARDQPISLFDTPRRDHDAVIEAIENRPPPSGAGNLQAALERAVRLASRGEHGTREIVVFTDRQKAGWQPENAGPWKRVDEALEMGVIKPTIWVVDVTEGLAPLSTNLSVGAVEVSRELTVPEYPIRIRAPVHRFGSAGTGAMSISLSIDGQRLAGATQLIEVPPNSESVVEFEHRFQAPGDYVVSINIDEGADSLKVDNSSSAAVTVQQAIPVLLIDGDWTADRTQRETFFASLALTNQGTEAPWVNAAAVSIDNVTSEQIEAASVVVLANLTDIPAEHIADLRAVAESGRGLLVTLGDKSSPQNFQRMAGQLGVFRDVELLEIEQENPDAVAPASIMPTSLQSYWLERFRPDKGGNLTRGRMGQWWKLRINPVIAEPERDDNDLNGSLPEALKPAVVARASSVVAAQLMNGDPWIVQTSTGDGLSILLTSSLDSDWNALTARPDYVVLMHELVFRLASAQTKRNQEVGSPLTAILAKDSEPATLEFLDARDEVLESSAGGTRQRPLLISEPTTIPGLYRLTSTSADANAETTRLNEPFVVNYDHSEDDITELHENDRAILRVNNRMTFVESSGDLASIVFSDDARSELWSLLLWAFLALLVGEVLMTRRIVKRGYADGQDVGTVGADVAGVG